MADLPVATAVDAVTPTAAEQWLEKYGSDVPEKFKPFLDPENPLTSTVAIISRFFDANAAPVLEHALAHLKERETQTQQELKTYLARDKSYLEVVKSKAAENFPRARPQDRILVHALSAQAMRDPEVMAALMAPPGAPAQTVLAPPSVPPHIGSHLKRLQDLKESFPQSATKTTPAVTAPASAAPPAAAPPAAAAPLPSLSSTAEALSAALASYRTS